MLKNLALIADIKPLFKMSTSMTIEPFALE